MPRPNDPPDVAASKTLAYILRHGAEKEGLHIRSDGLVKLSDILARPKVKNLAIDEATVFRLVEDNAKKRFEVVYGYDPSPAKPKKRPVSKPKTNKAKKVYPPRASVAARDTASSGVPQTLAPSTHTIVPAASEAAAVTTVPEPSESVSGVQASLAAISLAPSSGDVARESTHAEEWNELAFVPLPPPSDGVVDARGAWFIRATQGHSLKLEGTGHLERVMDAAGIEKCGEAVHGTQWGLWETLKSTGLSRMNRQHVHLAPALADHRILPRPNSTLLIFLDVPKMLDAGIEVYTAANGVVLTPGDAEGVVRKEYWKKAVRVVKGEQVVVWQDGEEVVA